MELTVISKKKHDELIAQINKLQSELGELTAVVNNTLTTNTQLAEIAFDENKFTQALLERCEGAAQEAARDSIDVDEIARDAAQYVELEDEVQRVAERLDLVDEDKVNDIVEEYVNNNNIMTAGEVDDVVEAYLRDNDYLMRDDVEDVVRDVVNEVVDERAESVAKQIVKEELVKFVHEMMHAIAGTNKLIKENTHAENSRDSSLHISGTDATGEARSYNASST